jgi:endonuclease/exonuclease/phosphatase (EEP) superfamily protein YafD
MIHKYTGALSVLLILALSKGLASCSTGHSTILNYPQQANLIEENQFCTMIPSVNNNLRPATPLDPEKISFLNWNMYKGNGEAWQQDLMRFARDHHVLAIQEAMMTRELAALLDGFESHWAMNTAFYLNGLPAGVMTLSTSPVLESCGFKTREPVIRIPKSTLVNYYAIEGSEQKLLVANIHGINFTLGINAYRAQLQQLHDAISHHDGPMIVAGDFNSWSDRRMREVQKLVDQLKLADIEYEVNNKTHVFGRAIDHVFYRGLEIIKERVWQVTSSDHNPISVDFRLSAAAAI